MFMQTQVSVTMNAPCLKRKGSLIQCGKGELLSSTDSIDWQELPLESNILFYFDVSCNSAGTPKQYSVPTWLNTNTSTEEFSS